jgi:uncharacterized membrane protein YeaQ/YmgE (transglycosylase-associated protein family)
MTFEGHVAAFALDPGGVISWIVVGLIAGALASRVVAGRGMGCVADLVVGVAGAFLGGIIFSVFGVQGTAGFFESIVVAFVGAALLLALLQALTGRRL